MITEKELKTLSKNELESLLNRSKKQENELIQLILLITRLLNNLNTEASLHMDAPTF